MSKTKLRVRDVEKEIPTVSPSLMPFRIEYSGPAPISTYFLTRPFIDADGQRRRLAAGTTPAGEGDNNGIDNVMNPPSEESDRVKSALDEQKDALAAQPVVGSAKDQRLLAAFRGRKVVSHNLALPDGYTGLILTSGSATKVAAANDAFREDGRVGGMGKRGNAKVKSAAVKASDRAKALKAKAAAKSKASEKRGARRSGKAMEEDQEEEGPVGGDELEPEDEPVQLDGNITDAGDGVLGDLPVEDKIFEVAGQFNRFTLWNPDAPIDEARDEYTRSLKEWIALAGEIHRI